MIESFPMFKLLMPWSELSIMDHEESESDDGPIFWVRPGEQVSFPQFFFQKLFAMFAQPLIIFEFQLCLWEK